MATTEEGGTRTDSHQPARSRSQDVRATLSSVMVNAKKIVGAERTSFFVYDPTTDRLSPFMVDGEGVPTFLTLEKGLAARAVRTRSSMIENDCYANPDFNRVVDRESGYHTRNMIVVPVVGAMDEVVGVVELLNKLEGDFDTKDLEILRAFTQVASCAFETSLLLKMANGSAAEAEIAKWMRPEERESFDIPVALRLDDREIAVVTSMNCFAGDFRGIGHFKECFFFFNSFGFLEEFGITNDRMFKFLYAVSDRYTDTSYHNWTHACDVAQFMFFQIKEARLEETYEKWELFTLLVAAICHDANHEGLNNAYNVKAETPLGILFKDQSVMETHHITEVIPIIERDDIRLFGAFDANEVRKVWTVFIRVILATDMAHHFTLLKRVQDRPENGKLDFSDPAQRLLGLKLLMKTADISNVSRGFEIADKWCDILNEEFFRQGDLEVEAGIGFTSPLNDRKSANKPRSQIGFYNFVCIPLFTVTSQVYPALHVSLDQLNVNLNQWKSLLAETE